MSIYIDTCFYYSCSLPCFKSHKSMCSGEQTVRKEMEVEAKAVTEDVAPEQTIKEELDRLFERHPQLRAKLDSIYQETLDPRSRRVQSQPFRNPRFEHHWTEEKGFEQGLRLLKAKLQMNTADQDDLRAFAALVSSKSDHSQ